MQNQTSWSGFDGHYLQGTVDSVKISAGIHEQTGAKSAWFLSAAPASCGIVLCYSSGNLLIMNDHGAGRPRRMLSHETEFSDMNETRVLEFFMFCTRI